MTSRLLTVEKPAACMHGAAECPLILDEFLRHAKEVASLSRQGAEVRVSLESTPDAQPLSGHPVTERHAVVCCPGDSRQGEPGREGVQGQRGSLCCMARRRWSGKGGDARLGGEREREN